MVDYTRWELWLHYAILSMILWFGAQEIFKSAAAKFWQLLALFIVVTVSDLLIHAALKYWTGWDD